MKSKAHTGRNVVWLAIGLFTIASTMTALAATSAGLDDDPSEPARATGRCTRSLSTTNKSCDQPNKVALELLSWVTGSGVSDNIADMRAKKLFSPQLFARYVKARGTTETFFLPFRGQDFFIAKEVPIAIAQTDVKKNEAKVIVIVTFDESFDKKPYDYNSQVITLLMREGADGNYKIFNAYNGTKWLMRDRGVFD